MEDDIEEQVSDLLATLEKDFTHKPLDLRGRQNLPRDRVYRLLTALLYAAAGIYC